MKTKNNHRVIITKKTFTITGFFSMSIVDDNVLLIYADGSLQFDITKFKICSTYLYLSGDKNVFFVSNLEPFKFETNNIKLAKVDGTAPDFYVPITIYKDFILFCKKVLTDKVEKV